VKAPASKHQAMSYERRGEAEKKLEAEVPALLDGGQQQRAFFASGIL
jgi:ABC-type histidine transport system ATPase subunit